MPVCNVGVLRPNGSRDQDETWHEDRPRPCSGHIVLHGDSALSPQSGTAQPPIFGPYLLCPNGWMDQDPRGRKVGLEPGDIASNDDPDPTPQKGAEPPIFGHCLLWPLWPNGWMDQDATSYGGRPRPRPHCSRWGPSSPKQSGIAPNFRPMSVVAKGLD